MSKFNYGLGKTYSSVSEAFRDANYAEAITRPEKSLDGSFWALLAVLVFLMMFGYVLWITISL